MKMIFPYADNLEKMEKYALVILAAKRSKQIKAGAVPFIETKTKNPITIALEEIAAGKITTEISRKHEIIQKTPSMTQSFAADLLNNIPDDEPIETFTDEELLELEGIEDIEEEPDLDANRVIEDDEADLDSNTE